MPQEWCGNRRGLHFARPLFVMKIKLGAASTISSHPFAENTKEWGSLFSGAARMGQPTPSAVCQSLRGDGSGDEADDLPENCAEESETETA